MAELGDFIYKPENMIKQEVVEASLTRLLKQGFRDENQNGLVYRGSGGFYCSAWPIDEVHIFGMGGTDGMSWDTAIHITHHLATLEAVKLLHDNYEPREWIVKFKQRFPDVDFSFLEKVNIHENCRSR